MNILWFYFHYPLKMTRRRTWLELKFCLSNNFFGLKKVLEKLENDSTISMDKFTDLFSLVSV